MNLVMFELEDPNLCAPIGTSVSIGVVYLQGREGPGPFSDADRLRAERFSRHVAVLADRLMLRWRLRGASGRADRGSGPP